MEGSTVCIRYNLLMILKNENSCSSAPHSLFSPKLKLYLFKNSFNVEPLDYFNASLYCNVDFEGGELLHPAHAAEAGVLYQAMLASPSSPFKVRLDAVQDETCFFETEGSNAFDLDGLSGIAVDGTILAGTNRSAVFDICEVW